MLVADLQTAFPFSFFLFYLFSIFSRPRATCIHYVVQRSQQQQQRKVDNKLREIVEWIELNCDDGNVYRREEQLWMNERTDGRTDAIAGKWFYEIVRNHIGCCARSWWVVCLSSSSPSPPLINEMPSTVQFLELISTNNWSFTIPPPPPVGGGGAESLFRIEKEEMMMRRDIIVVIVVIAMGISAEVNRKKKTTTTTSTNTTTWVAVEMIAFNRRPIEFIVRWSTNHLSSSHSSSSSSSSYNNCHHPCCWMPFIPHPFFF